MGEDDNKNIYENFYKNDEEANKAADLVFKDTMPAEYERLYGGYVDQLDKQLAQLTALRMSTEAKVFKFNTKSEVLNTFLANRLNDIGSEVDLDALSFVLEEKLSIGANSTLVYRKNSDDSFDVYIPTTDITSVSPSGKLEYLQLIRYIKGGDLITMSSEIHTLTETSYAFYQYEDIGAANADIAKSKENPGRKMEGKKVTAHEANESLRNEDFKNKPNKNGWIDAVYFENIPTIDKRGRSDFNKKSKYRAMLDKIFVRFHWEIDFNKSKFIQNFEAGTNLYAAQFEAEQGRAMIDNNYTYAQNDFMSPMGNKSSASQYFETSNQNLLAIVQLFNYFLKKYWEECGQHQSGSDIGKQISDVQAYMEKGAEDLRFSNKVLRRKHVWREFIWRMILEMSDKELGGYGKAPPNMKRSDIEVIFDYSKVELEKTLIENEILKMQFNLSDLPTSLSKVNKLSQGTDVKALSEQYIADNTKVIMRQLEPENSIKQKPAGSQVPNITNPQVGANNQDKKFRQQLHKKGEGNG